MKSDIAIAQEIKLKDISEVASSIGIQEDNLISFGRNIAKVVNPKGDKEKKVQKCRRQAE